MEEDRATQLQRMEKAQQELQDKFSQMMDMMAEGKWVAENPSSQKGHAHQNSKEKPLHPLEFTPHHAQTSYGAYVQEIPSVGRYPYTHMPHPVRQPPNNFVFLSPIVTTSPLISIAKPIPLLYTWQFRKAIVLQVNLQGFIINQGFRNSTNLLI